MTEKDIIQEINRLRKEKNAIILAHNYQLPEIQEVADLTGDSLELSIKAAETEADIIVFCGLSFMAETAKIVWPDKKVILPVESAGCAMADMIDAEGLKEERERYPGVPVVTYVNSTAEVKAQSDICCTSANAVKVVESLDADTVLMPPRQELGQVGGKAGKEKDTLLAWLLTCTRLAHHRGSGRGQEGTSECRGHGAPQMPS